MRADAQRNVAAIVGAGETCLARDPEVSMAEIARQAGVGRMTLYGHFPTRADLVEAVFAQVVRESKTSLDEVDVTGEPSEALRRLVVASWQLVHRFASVLAAAERDLSPAAIRRHHVEHLDLLDDLLARGQDAGAFRDDLPREWLATVCMTLMHAAAGEVEAGRLKDRDAEHAVVETILAACRS